MTARSQVALTQAEATAMLLAVTAVARTGTQEGLGTVDAVTMVLAVTAVTRTGTLEGLYQCFGFFLAITAVTRTGTQEGLGTEEGTARAAHRDTGQISSAPARLLRPCRSAAAEGLVHWVKHPWLLTQQLTLPSWKGFGEPEHLWLPKGPPSLWGSTAVLQARVELGTA